MPGSLLPFLGSFGASTITIRDTRKLQIFTYHGGQSSTDRPSRRARAHAKETRGRRGRGDPPVLARRHWIYGRAADAADLSAARPAQSVLRRLPQHAGEGGRPGSGAQTDAR